MYIPSVRFRPGSGPQSVLRDTKGLNIINQMIDDFYTMLSKLAADPENNFTVFDTRNTLTRNAAQPNGWANEIHPYFNGFTALANKFLTNLQAVPQFKSRARGIEQWGYGAENSTFGIGPNRRLCNRKTTHESGHKPDAPV